MDKLVVTGGNVLQGTVTASGSKNASLPILFASILSDKKIILERVPHLKDIETSFSLLRLIGSEINFKNNRAEIETKKITSVEAPYDLVRTMRASFWILGPLLAREGKARVSLPGGCAIGTRPVDLHLFALEKFGVQYELEQGYVVANCPAGLRGAEIDFPKISVGATEHAMMTAALAKGKTVLKNCAREPEVVDLQNFLNSLGAKIEGAGTATITIEGAASLGGGKYRVMFDRIEAGTLLLAGPITGGKVTVEGIGATDLSAFLKELQATGTALNISNDTASASNLGSHGINLTTGPHPEFPTDLQAQMMAYLTQIDAESSITETIFENRFMHVPELNRLGADIRIQGNRAQILGKRGRLKGATVMATDLRASASLVLAALAAEGPTHIRRIYHLDRGYEGLEAKLKSLGAEITRKSE